MGHDSFEPFQRNISGNNGKSRKISEKVVLEICFPFLQSHLLYQFQAFAAVSVNGTDL